MLFNLLNKKMVIKSSGKWKIFKMCKGYEVIKRLGTAVLSDMLSKEVKQKTSFLDDQGLTDNLKWFINFYVIYHVARKRINMMFNVMNQYSS